jgi:hypothetical protein
MKKTQIRLPQLISAVLSPLRHSAQSFLEVCRRSRVNEASGQKQAAQGTKVEVAPMVADALDYTIERRSR